MTEQIVYREKDYFIRVNDTCKGVKVSLREVHVDEGEGSAPVWVSL
jgi:hypothetical protein